MFNITPIGNFFTPSGNNGVDRPGFLDFGNSQGGVGSYFGISPANSASNQASNMNLDQLLETMKNYSDYQTNAQKEIQQDFFNQQKEYNAHQANVERDWQEKMANTAYQRMVKDLEKAGLSKYLAYDKQPGSISSVGASVGLPNSARGSDATSALGSLSVNNANRMSGIVGSVVSGVGYLLNIIPSVIDLFSPVSHK